MGRGHASPQNIGLLQRLQTPTSTAATRQGGAYTSPEQQQQQRAYERERKARAARKAAREKVARQQAQLWLVMEQRAATRLQAALRGKRGRREADDVDRARPGVRLAVREAERARIAAARAQREAEAAKAEAERRRLLELAEQRREVWRDAIRRVEENLREEKRERLLDAQRMQQEEERLKQEGEDLRRMQTIMLRSQPRDVGGAAATRGGGGAAAARAGAEAGGLPAGLQNAQQEAESLAAKVQAWHSRNSQLQAAKLQLAEGASSKSDLSTSKGAGQLAIVRAAARRIAGPPPPPPPPPRLVSVRTGLCVVQEGYKRRWCVDLQLGICRTQVSTHLRVSRSSGRVRLVLTVASPEVDLSALPLDEGATRERAGQNWTNIRTWNRKRNDNVQAQRLVELFRPDRPPPRSPPGHTPPRTPPRASAAKGAATGHGHGHASRSLSGGTTSAAGAGAQSRSGGRTGGGASSASRQPGNKERPAGARPGGRQPVGARSREPRS